MAKYFVAVQARPHDTVIWMVEAANKDVALHKAFALYGHESLTRVHSIQKLRNHKDDLSALSPARK